MTIELKKFCETVSGVNFHLQTPWQHGGFIHATNAQIYIRVPCNEYGKYPDGTIKNAHTYQKLFSKFVGTGVKVKASDLARQPSKCRDCAGVGTLADDGVEHYTCDWCMGTGVHFKPMLARERWGISSVYVEMCKWLPNCLIEADVKEGKAYKIYFDGGEGFVAPIEKVEPPTTQISESEAMKTVTVNAEALRQILDSMVGPGHLIRELQATRGPLVGKDNPIKILVAEYNAAVEKHNSEAQDL